ncbi:cancer/testis antigen 55 [Ictidomys tridecemlineatus]
MLRILRRFMTFLRKRADPDEGKQRLLQGDSNLRTIQGVVTTFCTDYGWIDGSIYFSTDAVTGNVPLKAGQKVTALVEEDKASHVLKAIKVDAISDHFDDSGPSDLGTSVLISRATLVTKDAVYINEDTCFSLSIIRDGFVPYQGDWLEVEYCVQPGISNINALSVKPMNCRHVDEVCISSVHGRHGVVADTIFFTLDSLKLPAGYVPQPNDIVDVVIVDSVQSCYIWRAVSMTPVHIL